MPAAFDAKDAALYLGIGTTKLDELKRDGHLRTIQVGGRPKFLRKNLDRFLEKLEKG